MAVPGGGVLRALCLNVGGRAAERVAAACCVYPGLDIYGFLETWPCVESARDLDQLLPGYEAWHCVRPQPALGRPHGGVSLFVRSGFAREHGVQVRCDEDTGINAD